MNYTRTRTRTSNNTSDRSFSSKPSAPSRDRRNSGGGKKKMVSSIDVRQLVKKAVVSTPEVFTPTRSFNDMPLSNQMKSLLVKKGYENPSEIQDKTFEYLKTGRNLLGIANTGTGKTAAFLIPIIEQLIANPTELTALIVVPTRELALQVEEEFRSLTKGLGLTAASFIGGTSVGKNLGQLRRRNHVIIGTPGRLKDMVDQKALHLHKIPVLVLDEFDRMLDMGFVKEIKRLVKGMTSRKQTMLFSATLDKTQKTLISELLTNPIEVKINSGTTTSDQVEQDIIRVPAGGDKFTMLMDMMMNSEFEKVLIFAETKRWVDKVTKLLNQSGVRADQIHGNKSQNYRNAALSKFKKGQVQVLVATDVAARGIDVSDVTHVINYQLPMTFDSYVHRIGRTGRAGKRGKAFTFVN